MLVPAPSPGETPLGTAFTYQGRLKDGGGPASGDFNMVFQLFDALTMGNQIGPTLTFNGSGANPPPVSGYSTVLTALRGEGARHSSDKSLGNFHVVPPG